MADGIISFKGLMWVLKIKIKDLKIKYDVI